MTTANNSTGTNTYSSVDGSNTASYINALIEDGLTYKWGGAQGTGATVTYSIPGANASWPDYPLGDEPTFMTPVNSEVANAFTAALTTWSNVANITFTKVNESATTVGDIRVAYYDLMNSKSLAWAYMPYYLSKSGDVWLNPEYDFWSGADLTSGHLGSLTLIHEIGHTLGLDHPEGDGWTKGYDLSTTVMSYNEHSNGKVHGNSGNYDYVQPSTPMIYDIAAIQYLYGANMSYHAGDDVYTFDPSTPFIETIWDAGGNDTISINNFSDGSVIDLHQGTLSSIYYQVASNAGYLDDHLYDGSNNLGIAFNVDIENAIGGSGNDRLIGNALRNVLTGNAGDDTLLGNEGNDVLIGGAGNDRLVGGVGDDTLQGDDGNDSLYGEAGNDRLVGGLGNDLLNGGDGNDTLFGQEGNDTLVGGQGNDLLNGGEGDDTLRGEDGNDTLVGGNGNDRLIGGAGNDQLQGMDGNDFLYGQDGNDRLIGGAGNDVLNGENGEDALYGQEGNDRLIGGDGNDFLNGGEGDDNLYGDNGADRLIGGLGNDLLNGGAGDDNLYGQEGADTLVGGAGKDLLNGGDGNDTLYGQEGADTLVGGAGNDRLIGGADNDTLYGETGNDQLFGQEGNDRLIGGDGNDVLNGGDGIDQLFGQNGDDRLMGGAGNDHLVGGEGNDTYVFGRGDGQDTINNFDASDATDTLLFGNDIASDQLWFSRQGDNLLVSIIGTSDSSTLQNWYQDSQAQIDQFQTASGDILLSSQIDNLVNAMAAFNPPATGEVTLNNADYAGLDTVIAANWSSAAA